MFSRTSRASRRNHTVVAGTATLDAEAMLLSTGVRPKTMGTETMIAEIVVAVRTEYFKAYGIASLQLIDRRYRH